MKKRLVSLSLALMLVLALMPPAQAKTTPAGETVGTVLFYLTNSKGEDILVSQIPVSEMEADMQAGKIDTTLHNYSVLDRFVTTVHQEAQGFTVGEFVAYAQSKSDAAALQSLALTFDGEDQICFWEIDQNGYDDLDTYTYNDLYGVARYNFPLLYQYWNYTTQEYYDPAGKLSRDEVIDYIFDNGENEIFLLSVRAFSQRYILTDEKYSVGDYNLESYWSSKNLLDNERTIRLLKPMTKEELYNKTSTAADTRYWIANIRLNMASAPSIRPLGTVAAPTATMTEDADNYYIRFACATDGATILYNHNYQSASYSPTSEYGNGAVVVPKSYFKDGTVTMTARAVKDGYTDAGVVTLTLTSSGTEEGWNNPYTDVKADSWYYDYVAYVMENALFDSTSVSTFSPDAPMTRAMLVTTLYRHAGSPAATPTTQFSDVDVSANYAKAVAWAYENGVVYGTSETTFAPDASITREQITALFYRYAEKIVKADMTASNALTAFTDAGELSSYAIDSMKWAVGAGLISGTTDTTIVPQGTATRAQTAVMVMRLAAYIG